jgi:L-galactose dehydrogenase
VKETLPALHKLKETGKIRYIGITGFPLKIFRYVIEQLDKSEYDIRVDTILSYCHYSMNNTTLEGLIPFLKDHSTNYLLIGLMLKDIGVINAATLVMGLFTNRGPPTWHPASPLIKGYLIVTIKVLK